MKCWGMKHQTCLVELGSLNNAYFTQFLDILKNSDCFGYYLSVKNPNKLIKIIKQGDLDNSELTYALESLGNIKIEIFDILIHNLKHKSSVVREGSLYGLAMYYNLIRGIV